MYCDGSATLKKCAVNTRATAIAQQCGLQNTAVIGDAYIGKCYDNEEYPWERVDISIMDVCGVPDGSAINSSSSWLITQACVYNKGKNMSKYSTSGQMQQFLHANSSSKTNPPAITSDSALTSTNTASASSRVQWTQTDEDVEVTIAVPGHITAKEVAVKFQANSISIAIPALGAAGEGVEAEDGVYSRILTSAGQPIKLYSSIVCGDCTWCISAAAGAHKVITITMVKNVNKLHWLTLFNN